jgi:hypothetical protein
VLRRLPGRFPEGMPDRLIVRSVWSVRPTADRAVRRAMPRGAMPDPRLTFVALSVSDFQRSVRFTRDVWAFPSRTRLTTPRSRTVGTGRACRLVLDGRCVHPLGPVSEAWTAASSRDRGADRTSRAELRFSTPAGNGLEHPRRLEAENRALGQDGAVAGADGNVVSITESRNPRGQGAEIPIRWVASAPGSASNHDEARIAMDRIH